MGPGARDLNEERQIDKETSSFVCLYPDFSPFTNSRYDEMSINSNAILTRSKQCLD